MEAADQVRVETELCSFSKLANGVVNWFFLNERPRTCVRVFVRLQIASMGTFQVLKLPLGFIRVLEWVSCNFCFFYVN